MPTYSLQAPDGKTYSIQGPTGATQAQVQAEILRQNPQAGTAAKVNTAADVGMSALSGLSHVPASLADTITNFIPGGSTAIKVGVALGNMAQRAVGLNPYMADPTPRSIIQGAHGPSLATPAQSPFSDAIAPTLYKPKTAAGRVAERVAPFAVGAVAPGTAVQRAANVALPALGAEGLGAAAEAMGGNDQVVNAARFIGGAVGGMASSVRAEPKAPALTLEDLATAKNNAYQAVRDSGITIKPTAVQELSGNIAADLAEARINPALHKRAAAMVEQLDGELSGKPVSLDTLDQWRQVVRRDVVKPALRAGEDGDALMGQKIIGQIDQFTEGLSPKHVTATGNAAPEEAAGLLQNARDLNTRYRKVEAVNDAMDAAGYQAGKSGSGGNIDNATRTQMHKVMKSIPNLTDDEHAALDRIILGGKGQDLLRVMGKASPQGSGLALMGELGLSTVKGGGKLGLGMALAGLGAKLGSDKLTASKVQKLVQLMANGGTSAKVQAAAQAAQPAISAQNPYQLPPILTGALAVSPSLLAQGSPQP